MYRRDLTNRVSIIYETPDDAGHDVTSSVRLATLLFDDVISAFSAEEMDQMSEKYQLFTREMRRLTHGALLQLWGGVKSFALSGCNDENKVNNIYLF